MMHAPAGHERMTGGLGTLPAIAKPPEPHSVGRHWWRRQSNILPNRKPWRVTRTWESGSAPSVPIGKIVGMWPRSTVVERAGCETAPPNTALGYLLDLVPSDPSYRDKSADPSMKSRI